MNREAIIKVRDVIAGLPPERFDMSIPTLNKDGCGCISAHNKSLFGAAHLVTWRGLGDPQFNHLIMPPRWWEPGRYTRDQAVATIDHLLATGEVDWSVSAPTGEV